MPDRPKRHHTVPQFYLERFSNDGILAAVNVQTGRQHGLNKINASAESNFYKVADHPEDAMYFERALGQSETAVSAVYRDIEDGRWPLPPDRRMLMADFLTLQFLRGQPHRAQISSVIDAILVRLREEDPARFAEVMALQGAPSPQIVGGPVPDQVSAAVHIHQITTLLPKLRPFIAGRPWVLTRFDEPSLFTSDEPIVPLSQPGVEQTEGLGVENAFALLHPISRTLGLAMYRPKPGEVRGLVDAVLDGKFDDLNVDPEMAGVFNATTATHAHRFLFVHPDDVRFVPEDIAGLSARGGRMTGAQLPAELFSRE
ncbi:DUF4238 domain-containing protein [Microbacterium foliorum]|uniref:DUF4238 domain-containing protein n=1 Tax=Microbacterium foliorum TaxID=104336 RepID=A0A4Y5YQ67_9MICO|nr:DUF4238 domain-containing protein [Microbacterium foliorum]QDE34847.1 DUF4238 domain-containing protein [Microbacterium foliorum]